MNWRAEWRQRWQGVSVREQRLVWMAVALLAVALLWWLALAPALKILKLADAQHQVLDAQLRQMQQLQAQAVSLRALPTLDAQETHRALEASVKLLGASAQMTQQMDRVTVTLKAVDAQTLAQWLSTARQNAHAVPTEVHLKKSAAGVWDGPVVFTLAAP